MNRALIAGSLLLAGSGLLLAKRHKDRSVGGKLFEDAPKKLGDSAPAGTTGVKLGTYFSLPELTASTTATAQGIDNMPTSDDINRLRALVGATLDPLRTALGKPIRVTSGFRSPALNAKIGGASNSQHMGGEAADIMVDGMTGKELATRMLNLRDQGVIDFDQIVWYDPAYKPHVHVSYKAYHPRRLVTFATHGPSYTHHVDPRVV